MSNRNEARLSNVRLKLQLSSRGITPSGTWLERTDAKAAELCSESPHECYFVLNTSEMSSYPLEYIKFNTTF